MDDKKRSRFVDETLKALVDFVLLQKFADVPPWMDEDLTVSQLRALFRLAFHGSLTISALSRLLELGKPATSILVQQLVERKLVVRTEDPQDRRKSLVTLAALGSELVSERTEKRESSMRAWLCQLHDDDLVGLLGGLRGLLKIIAASQEALINAP